jgi:outer membrane biogenesis lipoprotein LolB
MARLGSAPPAARYAGVAVGPRLAYTFETQTGIPVDGTNASLRNMSPFTLRMIVPDALLGMVEGEAQAAAQSLAALNALALADQALALSGNTGATARLAESNARAASAGDLAKNVGIIGSAATGSNANGTANATARALARVSAIGDVSQESIAQLQSFVASGKFFNGQDSGFVSTLADAYTAADIALQLSNMLAMEPLTLLVNPTEMTVTHARIQTYQQRGRNGYIFEAWGADRPTISFSGSTAGFVAGAPDPSNGYAAQVDLTTTTASGYQSAARLDSAAWQNFMALYQFYRNNGYIYDTIGGSEAHLFIGSVAIDYDQFTYVGNIDSFEFTFDAQSPHRVDFNMEFHVTRIYDNDKSSAAVAAMTSGPLNPSPAVSLTRDVGTGRQLDPTDVSTVPFDLLPG